MTLTRRQVLAGLGAAPFISPLSAAAQSFSNDRFDPWLEVDASALQSNVSVISKLAGGRPILAVIKNNAYGLGLKSVAPILEPLPQIAGFAVVKTAEAMALRDAGIRKPVLLMGLFADADGADLVRQEIQLSICTDASAQRIEVAGKRAGQKPVTQTFAL